MKRVKYCTKDSETTINTNFPVHAILSYVRLFKTLEAAKVEIEKEGFIFNIEPIEFIIEN